MLLSEDRLVVACAGLKLGPWSALTIELHDGNQATLYLDQLGAMALFETLKVLMPPSWQSPHASPAIVHERPNGVAVQVGHRSA